MKPLAIGNRASSTEGVGVLAGRRPVMEGPRRLYAPADRGLSVALASRRAHPGGITVCYSWCFPALRPCLRFREAAADSQRGGLTLLPVRAFIGV